MSLHAISSVVLLLNVCRLADVNAQHMRKISIQKKNCVQKHVNKYLKLPSISVAFHLGVENMKMADKELDKSWVWNEVGSRKTNCTHKELSGLYLNINHSRK